MTAGPAAPVDVHVPGDKSISHRALILAALATGDSRISGLLDAEDTRATRQVLQALGVSITDAAGRTVHVAGAGWAALSAPAGPLDCANSGTTARLMLGLLAGCPFDAVVTGDESLRRRPMRRVTEPLVAAGAGFQELEPPARLPIQVHGRRPLAPIRWRSPVASAQVKSALLLAGITGQVDVELGEAAASRDHTERMLAAMGAVVRTEPGRDGGHILRLDPPARLEPLDLRVPGDFSSAFFMLAFAALAGQVRVRHVGLNPGRTGALQVLRRMGAEVEVEVTGDSCGEPFGDVVVRQQDLRGTLVGADEVPALLDEIPALAILASCAQGETRFDGVAELRVKESDRLAALVDNLRAVGVEAEAGDDHLAIVGRPDPRPGRVQARGDHRIAMAFGVLRAARQPDIDIDDHHVVSISFPDFWERLDALGKEHQHLDRRH